MKIICTDNYARESVADRLVAENVQYEREAQMIVDALNLHPSRSHSDYYVIKNDDYKLWRGMEELV